MRRYNILASIALAQGHKNEACRLWRRAYAIVTQHFDADHPYVQSVAAFLKENCGGVPDA